MKLKGYVILESMIAMIIVMMCFGFCVMIYNNIITGSRNKLKVLARIRIEEEVGKSKKENNFLDALIKFDEFNIYKKIIPYQSSENLYQFQLIAKTPDGIKLSEYNEIIHTP